MMKYPALLSPICTLVDSEIASGELKSIKASEYEAELRNAIASAILERIDDVIELALLDSCDAVKQNPTISPGQLSGALRYSLAHNL